MFFSKKATFLRIGIVFCLSVFILGSVVVGILQGTLLSTGINRLKAQNGALQISQDMFNKNAPVYLNGEWEYYPNVFIVADEFKYSLVSEKEAQITNLPIKNVDESLGPATYRMEVKMEESVDGFAIYLENYNEDFAIYVNGKRVTSVWGEENSKLLYTLSDYLFYIQDVPERETIEIIISANSNGDQALLYQNSVLFGRMENVIDYVAQAWRDDTFLIGMILVLVIIGLVFMLIRTKFDVLSSITLFDTFLVIRILLGYNVATYFIHGLFPGLAISNVDFVGLQYVAFFITGTFGCLLSQSVFDPKKTLPEWPIRMQICICIVGGLFTLLFYRYMPLVCVALLFILLSGSFLIVTWHVYHIVKIRRLRGYDVFQIFRSYYIGGIMAMDILLFRGEAYNSLVYAYVVFLFAHLVTRLIDSNASYKEVEKLNYNLEEMILERTHALTEANVNLSELSIRDSLTQAYNRLYFEEMVDKVLKEKENHTIYLCMFDLDYFKSINDRFGHSAGDDQLKYVVQVVNEILAGRGSLARIGGEEFVILLIDEPKESVFNLIESIRMELDKSAQINEKRTTASFGLVKFHKKYSKKEFLREADKCLYTAKKLGRNCIVSN